MVANISHHEPVYRQFIAYKVNANKIGLQYISFWFVKMSNMEIKIFVGYHCRLLKTQSKVKELTRESRNREEEMDEYRRKLDSVKNERRRAEKNVQEVMMKLRLSSLIIMLPLINRRNMLIFMSGLTSMSVT